MALKYAEAYHLLTRRVSVALNRLADRGDVEAWQEETADRIGVDGRTFKNWYYAKNPPKGPALLCLFELFGDDFRNEVLGIDGRRDGPDISAEIAQLEGTLAALKAKRAPVVPLKRRA